MEAGKGGGREEVVLIGAWPSPFVLRAKVALNLKGVQYENAEEVLHLKKKSELLLKSNPIYKKIPVLIHKQRSICESMIIVEYVDEVWPAGPAILPSDPYDSAVARFWAVYLDDKWFPNIIVILGGQSGEAKADATEQLVSGLLLLEEVFKKCSKGKGYFGGAAIGYLDIALGSYIEWIRVTEEIGGTKILDKEKTPLLFAWAEEFCKDDAVKDVTPNNKKLLEYALSAQPRWNAAFTKN